MSDDQKLIELVRVNGAVRARLVPRPALPPGIVSMGASVRAAAGSSRSDFAQRVTDKRVDLVAAAMNGLPPVTYLPRSDGIFVEGKRHLIAAPRKQGKSIGVLTHCVDMVVYGGCKIVIFDRENGAVTYAQRLKHIMAGFGLTVKQREVLARNLHYYEFPRLRHEDADALVRLARNAALVVFDATRMFLTDLGLKEGDADDYAEFMQVAVDPLFRAGVATVILDNTGHADKDRARGSSAKGDLNEVLLTVETAAPFSEERQGQLRLKLEPGNSRFGNEGEWVMDIGGGAFSPWRRAGDEIPDNPAFKEAALVAARDAGPTGLSQTKLLRAVREAGVSFTNEDGRRLLTRYAADAGTPIVLAPPGGKGKAQKILWTGS